MLKLKQRVKLSRRMKAYIKALELLKSDYWESTRKDNKKIKNAIATQLLQYQGGRCVYCGLRLGGTSDGEIEHIVPKARHPEFEYTDTNLALSCHKCNAPPLKGQREIIEKYQTYYPNCTFRIIHPYYDDVEKYIDSSNNPVTIRSGLSSDEYSKAEYTIEILGLVSPERVEARVVEKSKENWDKLKTIAKPGETDDELIERILTFMH